MPAKPALSSVVLVTGADLRRGAPGGTRSYVLGLSRFLCRRGFAVDIVSNGPVEDAPSECRIIPVNSEYRPSTIAFHRSLRRWRPELSLQEASVLHFQRPDDIIPMLRWPRLPPAVCTLHGDAARGIRRRRGLMASWLYLRAEVRALHRFGAIAAVDSRTAETYRRRYPRISPRIEVIPVAVGDSWIRVSSEEDHLPLQAPQPMFLFVGRLSVEKRVDRIIESIARTPALKGAKLIVAGSGPEAAALRRLADGLSVEFLGNLTQEALRPLYHRADALVLASEYEGLPTVALEALASGCPVISLAGSDLETILTDGRGVVVQDPVDLPQAMAASVGMRHSGPPITLPGRFTWSTVGDRILEMYRRAAEEERS